MKWFLYDKDRQELKYFFMNPLANVELEDYPKHLDESTTIAPTTIPTKILK